jgi:hypothetical protein
MNNLKLTDKQVKVLAKEIRWCLSWKQYFDDNDRRVLLRILPKLEIDTGVFGGKDG